ncbi:hypothetical protein [Niallia circulans]|uniref:hypothetical protein n=1 Tax=Niallia circulans TaxID=1397 RepID=UPI0026F019F0|nr:hypothetical protein [Niallia circulans]
MKHSFNFPEHVRKSVKDYVNDKINKTDSKRYYQEPTYTSALLSKLEGVVYSDSDIHIELIPTVFNDRGRNSAESRSGADLKKQIKKMKKLTRSPKVLVLNPVGERRDPYVCSGTKILDGQKYNKQKLADYFTSRILTTFDGDTREDFIDKVQDSGLPLLHVVAIKDKKIAK